MIKIFTNEARTNSYFPRPWQLTSTPFKAYRASSHKYDCFLAVASEYNFSMLKWTWNSNKGIYENCGVDLFTMESTYGFPEIVTDNHPSKIIITRKGTQLLVPCTPQEDEKIALVCLQGAMDGSYLEEPDWWERWRQEYKPAEVGVYIPKGAEILLHKWGKKHCVATMHMVLRFLDEGGTVPFVGHGRRAGDFVDEVTWEKGITSYKTKDYEVKVGLKRE